MSTSSPPSPAPLNDPPPPYPSRVRRPRRARPRHAQQVPSTESDYDGPPSQVLLSPDRAVAADDDADENTPLIGQPSQRRLTNTSSGRPRSASLLSSSSAAPSLAHTVLSLFRHDPDSDIEYDPDRHTSPELDDGAQLDSGLSMAPELRRSGQWTLLSGRAWVRYFRPVARRAYWAAVFHLLVLNFPYALAAFLYLFVFTLTGTTLLIALPLGAVLCFFDLLGARAFARGELALQSAFHGPLAYPPPYPPRPLFTRARPPTVMELEASTVNGPLYETSFYKNTYAMFTDSTSYQALFYFLVIKPSITLLLSLLLVVVVPVSLCLVLPAPAVLRAVRRLGAWQANVAVEGLYLAVS
ncbi:hypothetical protein PLICRDRAFT_58167 [Plicaturopsis crispa FD-325 SS-3]|uniref:Uncharacterized protein n=1 Tax=Plicaturopsis crispa FD-325 SS-3 TaxID=944288 RepID=A0A0C9T6J2_PLICR|nr:hypothetical protein PLICRDRAFT_58167 [Plicaturopsis crispa FD-325 SS-3]